MQYIIANPDDLEFFGPYATESQAKSDKIRIARMLFADEDGYEDSWADELYVYPLLREPTDKVEAEINKLEERIQELRSKNTTASGVLP